MALQFNPTVRGDAMPSAPVSAPNSSTRQATQAQFQQKTQQDESQTHALNMATERQQLRSGATFNLQNERVGSLLNVKA